MIVCKKKKECKGGKILKLPTFRRYLRLKTAEITSYALFRYCILLFFEVLPAGMIMHHNASSLMAFPSIRLFTHSTFSFMSLLKEALN